MKIIENEKVVKTSKDERRLGKIELSKYFLYETDVIELQKVMSNFIVLDSISNFSNMKIEYKCYCPFFRKLEEGEVIPEYKIIIHHCQESYSHITVEEVKIVK